jgi:hypothetical protein
MPSCKRTTCPQTGARTWIRDCLHDLRDHAQSKGLMEADAALRDAIVRVSQEAGVATLLSVKDLLAYQASESPAKALET